MIEIILLIEAIAHIGKLDYKLLKNITGKMLGDPYYLPVQDEVISLANAYGMNNSQIHREFGFNRKTISKIISSPDRNTIRKSTPLLTINEDQELYKFCKILDQIKKAGIYEKEKTKN